MIDIHMHVLPGLDDGAKDMDESLAMCRMAVADGVTCVVATPHMLDGVHDSQPDAVREAASRVRDKLEEDGLPLKLELGADVHVARDLVERVRKGDVLTVADRGVHLMVELPPDVWPRQTMGVIYELRLAGLTPIITHPERNLAVQDDPSALMPLVQADILIQITADSLTGNFGSRAQRCSAELVKRRMTHFVASDAHSASNHRLPGLTQARAVVEGLLSREEGEDIFVHRPTALLAGDYIATPEPLPRRKSGLLACLRRLFVRS